VLEKARVDRKLPASNRKGGPVAMPRKKQPDVVASMQIVFRVGEPLYLALQAAAAGLGVDLSNLLRMILAENIGQYLARGRKAAAALEQARLSAQPEAAEQQAQEGAPQGTTWREGPRRTVVMDTAADQEGTPEVT
jgi:hypothetical protein